MAPARHCGLNCCQTFFATECERIGITKLKQDVPQQGILGPRRSCVFIRHQSQPTGSAWQRQDLLNLPHGGLLKPVATRGAGDTARQVECALVPCYWGSRGDPRAQHAMYRVHVERLEHGVVDRWRSCREMDRHHDDRDYYCKREKQSPVASSCAGPSCWR
jgi:hypothetical protein